MPHKEQGVKIRCEQRLKDVPMFARDEIARILEKLDPSDR